MHASRTELYTHTFFYKIFRQRMKHYSETNITLEQKTP